MTALRRGIFLLAFVATSLALAACENTIRGAGKDIEETGEAVSDTVQ
jgi:predicted small secreted protein